MPVFILRCQHNKNCPPLGIKGPADLSTQTGAKQQQQQQQNLTPWMNPFSALRTSMAKWSQSATNTPQEGRPAHILTVHACQVKHCSRTGTFLVGLTCLREFLWKGLHQHHKFLGREKRLMRAAFPAAHLTF